MITILLADDHALVREGLRRLLQDYPDLKVVGESSDSQETLRIARQRRFCQEIPDTNFRVNLILLSAIFSTF